MASVQGVDKYVTVNGVNLHYVDWGAPSSPPLVMLHGLSLFAHVWDDAAEALAAHFRVLALDLRGHGGSGWAPGGVYNSMDYYEDFVGFVDAMAVRQFVAVGHSLGGGSVMAYASAHPDRVRAAVIVDIGPTMERRGGERMRGNIEAMPKSFATWDDARAYFLVFRPRTTARELAATLQWQVKEEGGRIVWQRDPGIFDRMFSRVAPPNVAPPPDRWVMVRQIQCPTLIIRGAKSNNLSPEGAEQFRTALPHGELVEVENAGHNVFSDNPQGFNAALVEWLRVKGLMPR